MPSEEVEMGRTPLWTLCSRRGYNVTRFPAIVESQTVVDQGGDDRAYDETRKGSSQGWVCGFSSRCPAEGGGGLRWRSGGNRCVPLFSVTVTKSVEVGWRQLPGLLICTYIVYSALTPYCVCIMLPTPCLARIILQALILQARLRERKQPCT